MKEKISLKMSVKNVDRLSVRVFEINTENYLKEKKNRNYSDIDVSGLIPFEEYEFNYEQPPMV